MEIIRILNLDNPTSLVETKDCKSKILLTVELQDILNKQLRLCGVVVPKGTVCGYCNDTGWDSYPNHDTTPRPCPECQP